MTARLNHPIKCYAVSSNDESDLARSSSGGAFSILARRVIDGGGVVYGHAFCEQNAVRCVRIDAVNELSRLRGSKYVQSDMGEAMPLVANDLRNGLRVLFSGTPCQVAGLKSFLDFSNIKCDDLFLIDIVCHGVPSQRFFLDCIEHEYSSNGEAVICFRDKKLGWGCSGSVAVESSFSYKRVKPFDSLTSYYYSTFINAETYRESCYRCPYARPERSGDVTLGDFWGIDHVSAGLDSRNGISLVLVNSEKGLKLARWLLASSACVERPVAEAIRGNDQLRKPADRPSNRDSILEDWSNGNLSELERRFMSENKLRRFLWRLKWRVKRLLNR